MKMTRREKQIVCFSIREKKMWLIWTARLFEVKGNVVCNSDEMRNLLVKIYSNWELQNYEENAILNVISALKNLHNLETWMEMSSVEKQWIKLEIQWKTSELWLVKIARMFGIDWRPTNQKEIFRQLMVIIFGEIEMQKYETGIYTRTEAIMKNLHTFDEWMVMKKEERVILKLKIDKREFGLIAIAWILKTLWDPVNRSEDFMKLMIKIYGRDRVLPYLKISDINTIISTFQKTYDLEKSLFLTRRERQKLKIQIWEHHIGLLSISNKLNTWKNPIDNTEEYMNLMIKIYWAKEVEKYSHLLKTKPKK